MGQWHYVYEVGREEFPPSAEEFSQDGDVPSVAPAEEGEPSIEEPTGAAMPFEVREQAPTGSPDSSRNVTNRRGS